MSVTQEFVSRHDVDEDGNPAGGETYIDLAPEHPTHPNWRVLYLRFQEGPLGPPPAEGEPDTREPNGIFVETLIATAIDRLMFYEVTGFGKFECEENKQAIQHLEAALAWLNARTERRIEAGTEGTHEPDA